jgi:hypothetical protein
LKGRRNEPHGIPSDNDEEAKYCTEQLVVGHAIELWQEARKVLAVATRPFPNSWITADLANIVI